MERAVAYLRVSTERQGRSSLGLEAQREIIAQAECFELVGEFVEVETGTEADDPAAGLTEPIMS